MNARQTVLVSLLLAFSIFVVAEISTAHVQSVIQNQKQVP